MTSALPDPIQPIAPSRVDDLDDDDRLIGRVLSRREVLALMGIASVGVVAAACAPGAVGSAVASASDRPAAPSATLNALPACVVVPELTEGPYYVDGKLERADIRVDTASGASVDGATLRIDWVVSQVDGNACIPIEGVLVDVWHCDAEGTYSDVQGAVGHDFLRGYVHSDANGRASITTIYPGWYSGRAVHIHFKVRTDPAEAAGFEFTSQLFFDDAFSDRVYGSGIYAAKGPHDVQNADDGIYQQSQGMTLLDVTQDGEGYATTFEIAVKVT